MSVDVPMQWRAPLVILSFVVAMAGSGLSLYFAERLRESRHGPRLFHSLLGALSMGLTLWLTDYIGLRAIVLPLPVMYDPHLLQVSLLLAILSALVAFVILQRAFLNAFHWLFGSMAMGLAVASVHYTDMAALRMAAHLVYDPLRFTGALLLSMLCSSLALWLVYRPSQRLLPWAFPALSQLPDGGRRVAEAALMGGGMAGLHYLWVHSAQLVSHLETPFSLLMPYIPPYVGDCPMPDLLIWARSLFALALLGLTASAFVSQQKTLEALRESEERFRTIAEASAVLISIRDLSGRGQYYNQTYLDFTGLSREALSQTELETLIHPDDYERAVTLLHRSLQTVSPFEIEFRFRHRDGSYHWLFSSVRPLPGADGKTKGFISACIDINDRKRSEDRFKRLFDSGVIGIGFWRQDGLVTEANPYLLTMLGLNAEDVANGKLDALAMLPPLDENALAEMAQTRQSKPCEKQMPHRDGHPIDVLMGRAYLDDSNDEGVAFILDITEKKRAEKALQENQAKLLQYAARLEKSNKDLEQFATVTSHDLQAPLRKISIFTDTLSELLGPDLSPDARDYMDRIQRSIVRMQALITDLLTLSRIDRKGNPFCRVSLVHVLEASLQEADVIIREANGEIRVLNDLPAAEVDERQMQQVFINLIENAMKYHQPNLPPQMEISATVRTEDAGEVVIITVADNGIGFEQKHAERIFGFFERLHSEKDYPGTGMGLAITRRIIERHQGRIEAFSEPDQGARFVITLPLRQLLTA